MTTYCIASNIYHQTIQTVLAEQQILVAGTLVSDEVWLSKLVKENLGKLCNFEAILIDLECVKDHDDQILEALQSLRMMNDTQRIIVLAAGRHEGDPLLTKIFQLGIWDIIRTGDYGEIREELAVCVTRGKSFREAAEYMTAAAEKPVIRQEIKRVVNKVMVAVAGSGHRVGCTHQVISLANTLRDRGFFVAVAEANTSGAFETIRTGYEADLIGGKYFSVRGVEYYPAVDAGKIADIMAKSYNFVLIDFGSYLECDQVTFQKAEVKLLVAASKLWELPQTNHIFEITDEETLKTMNFLFVFYTEELKRVITDGMKALQHVYFLPLTEDPFAVKDFPAVDEIFADYLPQKIEPGKKKRRLFGRRGKEETI